jgi:hypothetical protein
MPYGGAPWKARRRRGTPPRCPQAGPRRGAPRTASRASAAPCSAPSCRCSTPPCTAALSTRNKCGTAERSAQALATTQQVTRRLPTSRLSCCNIDAWVGHSAWQRAQHERTTTSATASRWYQPALACVSRAAHTRRECAHTLAHLMDRRHNVPDHLLKDSDSEQAPHALLVEVLPDGAVAVLHKAPHSDGINRVLLLLMRAVGAPA